MLHKAGWPRGPGRVLLDEIFGLAKSGERILPYQLAVAARSECFNGPKVLSFLWQMKDGEITIEGCVELVRKELSSFRQRVDRIEAEEVASRRNGNEDEIAVADLGLDYPADEELNQFHLRREAEQDRKRVCPPLPNDELRRVMVALRERDWTQRDRWLRVESLRRWFAMSPEAIRQAARTGRWSTDIAIEPPYSRRGRGGRPNDLLGPRAVARVLRAYAASGVGLREEAETTAAVLAGIGRAKKPFLKPAFVAQGKLLKKFF